MREKTAAKYRDASLPAAERAQDLLERMTLEEKLAQLGSYWVYQINDGFIFPAGRRMNCCPPASGRSQGCPGEAKWIRDRRPLFPTRYSGI